MDKDFEMKRLVIGLATLTLSPDMADPQVITPRAQQIMKSIVELCKRSLHAREKKLKKEEEVVEDKDCEKRAIYDEDDDADGEVKFADDDSDDEFDDWSNDDDSDGELEDSQLYNVDEILFVKQKFEQLQQANQDQWNFMLSQLDDNEKQLLLNSFEIATQQQNKRIQEEQQAKQEFQIKQ